MSPDLRIWRHIFLITVLSIISINYALPPGYSNDLLFQPQFYVFTFLLLVLYTLALYTNIYYLIPAFLLKKRYTMYFVALFVAVVLMLIAQYSLERLYSNILDLAAFETYNLNNKAKLIIDVTSNFSMNLLAYLGGSITVLMKSWIQGVQQVSHLEQEQLQNEVNHLKEQVAPEFLFNIMNHIGRLEKENTVEASAQLYKLCRILRYQLYDGNMEEVFLMSEIRYLTTYLELQQLNYPRMKFDIQTRGDVFQTLVPPFLFIAFVQAMMKKIPDKEYPADIKLLVNVSEDSLCFTCEGSNLGDVDKKDLHRVKQRLNLLFTDSYRLEIGKTAPAPVPGFVSLQLSI